MAPTKQQPEAEPQESLYPVIESFVEQADAEEVGHFFDSVRDGLSGLKGPRADHAKKIQTALARTEELLSHLLQVREKLEAEKKAGGKARK